MLTYFYRVTKYDPFDRDAHGSYTGLENTVSDHREVEEACLQAAAAFARDTGIDHLAVREPAVPRRESPPDRPAERRRGLMTVTLGELYDVLHHRLEQVTDVTLPGDDVFAHALAIRQLDTLAGHVNLLLGQQEDPIDAAAGDTFRHLRYARRALGGAPHWLPPVTPYALACTTRSAQAYHLRHASRVLHSEAPRCSIARVGFETVYALSPDSDSDAPTGL
ncbi:hypothetical protein ACH4MG_38015 [Streptomyces sp. NPDC017454]|uniref:hypothetical protein n=1 Tax=Streptomyces sp. NPDC017454 TaxID=3364997 RepID=UPI0037B89392